jgi:hypothetical protein
MDHRRTRTTRGPLHAAAGLRSGWVALACACNGQILLGHDGSSANGPLHDSGTSASSGSASSSGTTSASGSTTSASGSATSGSAGSGDASSGTTSQSGSDASGNPSSTTCGISLTGAGAGSLVAPAPGAGQQFSTTAVSVAPGQPAAGFCLLQTVSSATNLVGFESLLSLGVDEVVVFRPSAGLYPQGDGFQACPSIAGEPLYVARGSGQTQTFMMPAGVGLPIAAGAQFGIYERLLNGGMSTLSATAQVNALYAPDSSLQYKAGVMAGFNPGIDVPPATAAGPGTQTVAGSCSVPAGSQFFAMTTSTGADATAASITYVNPSAGLDNEVVHTGSEATYPADQQPGTGADFARPGFGVFCPPLKVQPGDSFNYSCSYVDTGSSPITVGPTAPNEWCLAIGYFFPAGTVSCN